MKKRVLILLGICAALFAIFAVAACVTDPGKGPEVTLNIPELFSPDPDIPNDKLSIGIAISHPAPISDWTIEIQPNRGGSGGGQRAGGGQGGGEGRQPRAERAEGQPAAEGEGGEQPQRRRRAPFFEQTGNGKPPATWQWDGKSTREPRNGGDPEMVQSATAYRFNITVNDKFGNSTSQEGIIEVDVLVKREGENLRIIVPSIVFPPSSADLSKVSEAEARANSRVIRLIANALKKYDDYAVTAEGHSNPVTPPGTPERTKEEKDDQALSEQRAGAVVGALVNDNGVDRGRLTVRGMSCTQTVADYDDEDENWKNRRVEFLLIKG